MKKIIFTPNAPKPIGPYSQAILNNNTLYVSGQIPVNPATGKIDEPDIQSQTKQVMENIRAILNEANMDFPDVLKTSIFITDIKNFPLVNEIYASYFSEQPPARETIQVCKLPMNADVEISLIAGK